MYRKPSYIVLDTRHMVKELISKMSGHAEVVGSDELIVRMSDNEEVLTQLFDEIIQLVAFRDQAELSLQYESMALVHDTLFSAEVDNVVEFGRFMVEFGMFLVEQLQNAGAYRDGKMSYSYHGRLGHDIVLVQTFFNPHDDEPNTVPCH